MAETDRSPSRTVRGFAESAPWELWKCGVCKEDIEEGGVALHFTKGESKTQNVVRYHPRCTPDVFRRLICRSSDFNGYEELNKREQEIFDSEWEGASGIYHEDSDTDPEDCGIIPCLRKPTQQNRFAKKRWHYFRRREAKASAGGMQNVRPSTAAFAYFVEQLNTTNAANGTVAQQAKKYITEFKSLPREVQQKYYDKVLRDRLMFEQKERYLKVLHKAEELKDKDKLKRARELDSKAEESGNIVKRVISCITEEENAEMEEILNTTYDITNYANLQKILQFSSRI